jgi:hypothetical protein
MKTAIDNLFTPGTVFVAWFGTLGLLYLGRRWFVRPVMSLMLLAAILVFFGVSLRHPGFAAVATAPDNIAVLVMFALLGFFTWLATSQAVKNDVTGTPFGQKTKGTEVVVAKQPSLADPSAADNLLRPPPAPSRNRDSLPSKVSTWPDLVYSELICAIVVMTLLLVWSLLVPAPLEQPANAAMTPNPSKAPWYFLGLQELLFHADAWLAGLLIPSLIVVALLALPYLDRNPAGNGYYTIRQRPVVYLVFQFIFWLWLLLILIGAFLRGPNWQFHWPL